MATASTTTSQRILVAMSGGVDSSVAAALLRRDGHDLVGVNMRTHKLTQEEIAMGARIKTCCSPTDAKDARSCAIQGDFPFYVLDVEMDFKRDVIDPFVMAYLAGQTPNPCVLCNNYVKLGLLLEKAEMWKCDLVATGHYARKTRHPETGRWALAIAEDTNKDQTYYLFGLKQHQLEKLHLPLGELTKEEVRRIAREEGIPTADKPESQEICFIPSNDYRAFLEKQFTRDGREVPRGRFISVTGEDLGEHRGIPFYTVGQRRGLDIAIGYPLYVVELDVATNNVIVGPREALFSRDLVAKEINWMALDGLAKPRRAWVRIRHRHAPAAATLHPIADEPEKAHVVFDEPQQAVTPGQAAVFYDEENRVLGGGWIEKQRE
ncbi:MAG: tRNA 2-thiouridine(34) synthase MnmA [Candidatus Sumerlaeia bacterium]|nr:tRNA 2-thiouridine(34) synthase MnmA [Candidatus Sumerlaeia bacterium]